MTPSYADRLDRTVRGVLGAILKDYQRGVIDREDVDKAAERRANAIRAAFPKLGQAEPTATRCMSCEEVQPDDAMCVIAGKIYCRSCAPMFRPALPMRGAA